MKHVASKEMVENALGDQYDDMAEPPYTEIDKEHPLAAAIIAYPVYLGLVASGMGEVPFHKLVTRLLKLNQRLDESLGVGVQVHGLISIIGSVIIV